MPTRTMVHSGPLQKHFLLCPVKFEDMAHGAITGYIQMQRGNLIRSHYLSERKYIMNTQKYFGKCLFSNLTFYSSGLECVRYWEPISLIGEQISGPAAQ